MIVSESCLFFFAVYLTIITKCAHNIQRQRRGIDGEISSCLYRGFPGDSGAKRPVCQCVRPGFDPWIRKIPCGRKL